MIKPSRSTGLLLAMAGLIGFVLCIPVLWLCVEQKPIKLGVAFQYYTNDSSDRKVAVFRLTNPHRKAVDTSSCIQPKLENAWVWGAGPQPFGPDGASMWKASAIAPRGEVELKFLVPTTGRPWRVFVLHSSPLTLRQETSNKVKDYLERKRWKFPAKFVQRYMVCPSDSTGSEMASAPPPSE